MIHYPPPVEASQSQMETATDAQAMVSPRRVKDSPFALKAWVVFDGTTTPPSILASQGVSGVSRDATGDFTITFSTAFSSANFAVVGSSGQAMTSALPTSTTTARMITRNTSATAANAAFNSLMAAGDQ